jgi:hypothetical protein
MARKSSIVIVLYYMKTSDYVTFGDPWFGQMAKLTSQ